MKNQNTPESGDATEGPAYYQNRSLAETAKLIFSGVPRQMGTKKTVLRRKKSQEMALAEINRQYDICLSFAGEDRVLAHKLAKNLRAAKLSVFYDEFEKIALWGKNLYEHLHRVYSQLAQFCVILYSQNYRDKPWTRHELRAAQSRALSERGEYVLPVKIDDVDLPPEMTNVAYIKGNNPSLLSKAIIKKMQVTLIQQVADGDMVELKSFLNTLNENLLYQSIIDLFVIRLSKEANKETALATALCAFIVLTQDFDIPHVQTFVNFLLNAFPPLSQRFDTGDGFKAIPPHGNFVRWYTGHGNFELLMKEEWVNQVMSVFANYTKPFRNARKKRVRKPR